MSTLDARVHDFLAHRRIAVAGVSRTKEDAANLIYRRFRDRGYQVFPPRGRRQTRVDAPVDGTRCQRVRGCR